MYYFSAESTTPSYPNKKINAVETSGSFPALFSSHTRVSLASRAYHHSTFATMNSCIILRNSSEQSQMPVLFVENNLNAAVFKIVL